MATEVSVHGVTKTNHIPNDILNFKVISPALLPTQISTGFVFMINLFMDFVQSQWNLLQSFITRHYTEVIHTLLPTTEV